MSGDGKSVFPEILEPIRRQRSITNRGHDRAVTEIGLNGASVVAASTTKYHWADFDEERPCGVVGLQQERD
jgi:hypothetical protein